MESKDPIVHNALKAYNSCSLFGVKRSGNVDTGTVKCSGESFQFSAEPLKWIDVDYADDGDHSYKKRERDEAVAFLKKTYHVS